MPALLKERQELLPDLGGLHDRWSLGASASRGPAVRAKHLEIFELHPGVLNQVGLAPALHAVAERQAAAGSFSPRRPGSPALQPRTRAAHQRCLSRRAQRRRSPSPTIERAIFVEAHDNGRGFDPRSFSRAKRLRSSVPMLSNGPHRPRFAARTSGRTGRLP
jgi:hypothetical protein